MSYSQEVYELVQATTRVYRKGEQVVQREGVTEVFDYPHVSEAKKDTHDLHFIEVEVHDAEGREEEFVRLMDAYPEPERLWAGPSYIETGAVLGDQETALRLYALGEALGYWKIITPGLLGMTGKHADELAGRGMVMHSGYRRKEG